MHPTTSQKGITSMQVATLPRAETPWRVRARAHGVTLARIAAELDLLAIEVAQIPEEAVEADFTFGIALHHLREAAEALGVTA